MSRILYWNVNNFSLAKIQNADPLDPTVAAAAAARLNYMVNNIMRGPTVGPYAGPPDIIIVVEVFDRTTDVGVEGTALIPDSNSGKGLILLLNQIRATMGANWCLVPPLSLGGYGFCEAVAVFYNSTNLQFTGPNLYYQIYGAGNPTGQSQPVNATTAAAIATYPAAWAALLPTRNVNFPAIGANIPENQLAAEWQYNINGPNRHMPPVLPPHREPGRISFPNYTSRGPFLTSFLDLTTPLPNQRTLNLFTIHTSPDCARQAVINMQIVPEMIAVPAGQVNVILGDFNVDTFSGAADAYTQLIPPAGIYTLALDPRVGHAGNVVPTRKPYCITHLLSTPNAMPYNAVGMPPTPQNNIYPRYGYMGSIIADKICDSGAIDNFLTAYGAGLNPPAANNITIINTVTGTPYNLAVPPPTGVTAELTSGLQYASAMAVPNMLFSPPANTATGGINPINVAAETTFQNWNNYGKIYSTSDHLPLMIDI